MMQWLTWLSWALAALSVTVGGAQVLRKQLSGEEVRPGDVLFPLMYGGMAAGAPAAARLLFTKLTNINGGGSQQPAPEHHADLPAVPWGTVLLGLVALIGVFAVVVGVSAGTSAVRRRRKRRHSQATRRRAVEARHDAVREEYGAFQSDILAVLERPALADVTVPTTARLIHALAAADDARAADRTTDEGAGAYQRAVTELEMAWTSAAEHARKTGLRTLPPRERKAIEQARKLLSTALADGGTEHERRHAYEHARKLLDEATTVTIPRQATAALEATARPSLSKPPTNDEG
ncbi:hypothetical protein ACIQU6_30595 [Streptomyces sp. NPDC090442]|uniref:hypothetical protein n=1 Tax=Streptomyces sp. NPDC090442 TaxID=3365962 RepID=UPI0037FD1EAB